MPEVTEAGAELMVVPKGPVPPPGTHSSILCCILWKVQWIIPHSPHPHQTLGFYFLAKVGVSMQSLFVVRCLAGFTLQLSFWPGITTRFCPCTIYYFWKIFKLIVNDKDLFSPVLIVWVKGTKYLGVWSLRFFPFCTCISNCVTSGRSFYPVLIYVPSLCFNLMQDISYDVLQKRKGGNWPLYGSVEWKEEFVSIFTDILSLCLPSSRIVVVSCLKEITKAATH